jgi:hypothetical protein
MIEPFRYSVRYPVSFPEWTDTRVAAESRKAPITGVRCAGCGHEVDFQSHGEQDRFLRSSGWKERDDLRTLRTLYSCPVC